MKQLHTLIHRLHNPDVGMLLVRIALGIVFIHAGWLKVADMNATVTAFGSMGFGAFLAYFVSYAELLGGVLFMLGLFVRYVGIVIAVIMLVATKLLFANGFGLMNGGYEYPFMLMLISIAVVTLGAGKYSLACMLKKK